MLAPCSANVRATSSSSRARSHAVDRDLDAEARRGRAGLPLDRREPLRVPHQRLHVRAVGAVDRDPAPERDVARGSRRPGTGVQHFASRTSTSSTPGTTTPSDSPVTIRLRAGRLDRDHRLVVDLVGLQALEHLVDDLARADLARAEREVEVLGLLEAELADHRGEHARALELAVRQVLRLERLVERLAALLLGLALASRAGTTGGSCCGPATTRASDSQSRDGPRPDFEVRISTKSPFFRR